MKHVRSRRHIVRPMLFFKLSIILLVLLASPINALAHPLDVYLQATYITVGPTQIEVELDLSPGVLVSPQILPLLDMDSDQQISRSEGQRYVEAMLQQVELQVDGKRRTLAITKIDLPTYLNLQAGYGTIRIFSTAALEAGMTGRHQISYTNKYAPTGSAYQVNAFADASTPIALGTQSRDSAQQSMTMVYEIGHTAPATASPAVSEESTAARMSTSLMEGANSSVQAQQLQRYLSAPTQSAWMLLVALAVAGILGGLHALTPGHGKTLVAAYLVGSRGTVRHAIALGGIVTFTHTASVIGVGLLALFASQYIVPDLLVPILEVFSGILVVVIGARLIWQRWVTFHNRSQAERAHAHDHIHHEHGHTHHHDHDLTLHDHGDGHIHSHLPAAEDISLGSLIAMGVSGGLVPCPEALGIMVLAIGLHQALLGLGLIIAFSFGLAAVLIAIGILLVRSRSIVDRFGGIGRRWSQALPLCSAILVTTLGIGMTLSGLTTYLG